MRRIALALLASTALVGAANAADLVRKGAPPSVATAPVRDTVNWSGAYVGAFAGYGWGQSDWTGVANNSVDGWLGGGQIGFDQQFGQFVLGVQGDFAGGDIRGDALAGSIGNKTKWLGSVTGRVGVAVDRALFYVKGGGAWEDLDNSVTGLGTASKTRSGWTVGSGIEVAFAPHWSTFAEYDYYDFGKSNTSVGGVPYNISSNINVVKLGINYRFGGPADRY